MVSDILSPLSWIVFRLCCFGWHLASGLLVLLENISRVHGHGQNSNCHFIYGLTTVEAP